MMKSLNLGPVLSQYVILNLIFQHVCQNINIEAELVICMLQFLIEARPTDL